MGIEDKINGMRHEKLRQIEQAAQKGDAHSIISLTADIEILEKLKKQLTGIEQTVSGLENKSTAGARGMNSPLTSAPRENRSSQMNGVGLSPKRIGEMNRLAFVKDAAQHDISLKPVKGVLFRNDNNQIVGIAYASERTPNRWWLGLPIKDNSGFVLLCENDKGKMTRFIFPSRFYIKYKDQFSRDKDRSQLKFNISHRDGIYTLSMPDQGPICINEYIDAYSNLK